MALTPMAANTGTMTVPRRPSLRGERHLFTSSDDSIVMKQIKATHSPDGRDFDIRPLMHVVEDALRRATPITIVVLLFSYPDNQVLHIMVLLYIVISVGLNIMVLLYMLFIIK
jgi:Sieve element occlusion N-terminus